MGLYQLADRLGKSVAEIGELTCEELAGWAAFFAIQQKQRNDGR